MSFSTDERTCARRVSFCGRSLLLGSAAPCNSDSTDVNGGGLGVVVVGDDASIKLDEINVGLDKTESKIIYILTRTNTKNGYLTRIN